MSATRPLRLLDYEQTFAAHHTNLFPRDQYTFLRRGGAIKLAIDLGSSADNVLIQEVKLVLDSSEVQLRCSSSSASGQEVRCHAEIPFDAPVGAYHLHATLVTGDFAPLAEAKYHQRVVVTCNAWCVTDDVYLSEESERQEYVLQRTTKVYVGNTRGKPWNLGLYRKKTLQAVVGLLDRCSSTTRASVVTLSRELTSLLNSHDNNGVLKGNWSGDYAGGIAPWQWQGSAAILAEFVDTDAPVEYGQCWVYSGLLCTVLRVLGIPCRSVTTFDSAHDTERNRHIDRYYSDDGTRLEELCNDSIWNFHVWNEAWMTRPDLPPGYGGWQALDSTPQVESGGKFQTGPASVRAIKEGLSFNYDTNFVIAEVNADVREWVVGIDHSMVLSAVHPCRVGSRIVTKQVGCQAAQDIISNYKYAEGSMTERASLLRGDDEASKGDIAFEVLSPESDSLTNGSEVRVGLGMNNTSAQVAHKIDVHIVGRLCHYHGKEIGQVLDFKKSLTVGKESARDVETILTPANYVQRMNDKVFLIFHVFARVHPSSVGDDVAKKAMSQVFSDTCTVTLNMPSLNLTTVRQLTHGAMATVHFLLVNPLRVPLTGIEVHAEGDGLLDDVIQIPVNSINSQEAVTGSFGVRGLEVGDQEVMVSFHSDQLIGVESSAGIEVITDMADAGSPMDIDGDMFEVNRVDFQLAENRLAHFTDEFDDESALIVRRGQGVSVSMTLNKQLKKVNCQFHLVRAKRLRGKNYVLDLTQRAVQVDNFIAKTTIPLVADMPVGRYRLSITVQEQSGLHTASYTMTDMMVVLFNPWCKDDEVYMQDTDLLKEYVLNESGAIWVGTYSRNWPIKWDFSQFDSVCLEASLFLLEKMSSEERRSAVTISRKFSSLLNSLDNNGVLVGNWSGDYGDGQSPSSWTSSEEIFNHYMRNKEPVKYGQCFIFSAIMTTAFRVLGIPARPVTNFRSAHDKHFNRAVDFFCDENGQPIDDLNKDSIWNFHVWNEAWMRRDDLPPGYSGWQAVDATPQELSGQLYQTGPSSVRAIKRGQTLKFDTNFLIAEVNADRRIWVRDLDGEYQLKQTYPKHIGAKISTKAVGSMERFDLTDTYKFPEGSLAERASLGIAIPPGSTPDDGRRKDDVSFTIDAEETFVGYDIRLSLHVRNNSSELRSFNFHVTGAPILYTGKRQRTCVDIKQELTLEPFLNDTLITTITADTYMPHLTSHEQPWMEFVIFGEVVETKQCGISIDSVLLNEPVLNLAIAPSQGPCHVGSDVQMAVKLVNSTSMVLSNLVLSWNGHGLGRGQQLLPNDIQPKEALDMMLTIRPTRRGKRVLTCGLHSPQLSQVSQSIDIDVV